jgi:excisionase family DNA binding protein
MNIENINTIEEIRKELSELNKYLRQKSKASNTSPLPELLTIQEISDYFNVSLPTVQKWKKAGVLPKPIKMASRVYFSRSEVLEKLKS